MAVITSSLRLRKGGAYSRFATPLLLIASTALAFFLLEDVEGPNDPQRQLIKESTGTDADKPFVKASHILKLHYPMEFHADLSTRLMPVSNGPTVTTTDSRLGPGSATIPFYWDVTALAEEFFKPYYVECKGLAVAHNDDAIVADIGVLTSLVPSHYFDMLASPLFHPAVDLFDAENQGRAFAMFQHPVDVVVQWHERASEVEETALEFAGVGHRRNLVTRSLAGVSWEDDLTQEDLDLAKQILTEYFLVGLASQANDSMSRFDSFFGIDIRGDEDKSPNCGMFHTKSMIDSMNKNGLDQGSEDWNKIEELNQWDTQLYGFIEALYKDQADLVHVTVPSSIYTWESMSKMKEFALEAEDTGLIPKTLHFVWISLGLLDNQDAELPSDVSARINEWATLHPDWTIVLWHNTLIKREFPELTPLLQRLYGPSWIANLVRYAALERYGGVYLDTDIAPVARSLNALLPLQTFTVCEKEVSIAPGSSLEELVMTKRCKRACNAVIGAIPSHPALKAILEKGIQRSEAHLKKGSMRYYTSICGPPAWTGSALQNHFNFLHSNTFFPCNYNSKDCHVENFSEKELENTYGNHLWGNSWENQEKLFKEFQKITNSSAIDDIDV